MPPSVDQEGRLRALYVEDNRQDADLTARALARATPPIELDVADTVRGALEKLAQGADRYHWVLFDLSLPDGDGLEVLRHLREQHLPLPAIAVTGSGDEQSVIHALKLGADDYLIKHGNYLDTLPATLHQALARSHLYGGRHEKPLRILYVENDPQDSDLTRMHLAHHAPHLSLSLLDDPSRLTETLRQGPAVDVLLFDYNLRETDALTLTRQLRQELALDLPVVIVTGKGSGPVAAEALRLGVTDYLIKDRDYLQRLPAVLEFAYARAELMRERARLEHLAMHDRVTGLNSREYFIEKSRDILRLASTRGEQCAMLLIDLDDFKDINDTFGHDCGDEVLQQVAERCLTLLRENDLACRLGGDEFAICLAGGLEADTVTDICERLLQRMRQGVAVQGHSVRLTASIGISLFPNDAQNIETLIRYADLAMYKAKSSGRSQYCLFTPALQEEVERRFHLGIELQTAIERGELYLLYQPLWKIRERRLVGVEALLRWKHPSMGNIPPDVFIPIAEQSGLINRLGDWVLDTACAQLRAWRDNGLGGMTLAVNISAAQFRQPDFVDRLCALLARHGVPASDIELELTESLLAEDSDTFRDALRQLGEHGLHMAIDDFGTGYSSLSYLRRLPVRTIKVDRSFVEDLPDSNDAATITTAIIAMAHAMGCQVVAEGVETEAQLTFLAGAGCEVAQGYLLARPLPAEQIAPLARG